VHGRGLRPTLDPDRLAAVERGILDLAETLR
jgi:hypothetical protein